MTNLAIRANIVSIILAPISMAISGLKMLVQTCAVSLKRAQAQKELFEMSDKELNDIGISRYEIPNIIRNKIK